MIYEKLHALLTHYLAKENTTDELLAFQTQFTVLFDFFRAELKDEVGLQALELLDEMYMALDAYEPNAEIRACERYCIDAPTLMHKLQTVARKLPRPAREPIP